MELHDFTAVEALRDVVFRIYHTPLLYSCDRDTNCIIRSKSISATVVRGNIG